MWAGVAKKHLCHKYTHKQTNRHTHTGGAHTHIHIEQAGCGLASCDLEQPVNCLSSVCDVARVCLCVSVAVCVWQCELVCNVYVRVCLLVP